MRPLYVLALTACAGGAVDQTDHGTVFVTMSRAWCRGAAPDHLGAFAEIDEATGEVVARLDFGRDPRELARGAWTVDSRRSTIVLAQAVEVGRGP